MSIQVTPEGLRARAKCLRDSPGNNESTIRHLESAAEQIENMQRWIDDLQSGMYVNCVYCGHRYDPDEPSPVLRSAALKAHIEQCSKHPMAKRTAGLKELAEMIDAALRSGKGGDWQECARIVERALED